MKAMLLRQPALAETAPLALVDLPVPEPASGEILVKVRCCGVCHTDLHTVEGEIAAKLPIVPGHQIVGIVEKTGADVTAVRVGDRVGVPWLAWACGACEFCLSDRENLCDKAQFTGFSVNGGYAAFAVARAAFAVKLPDKLEDVQLAPMLCAGIIGYRALRLSGVRPQQRLGLYGFGASAHIAIQIAKRWGCEVFAATRAPEHQALAKELGATWAGRAEEMPEQTLHAAVMFAPAGTLVPGALRALQKGGTLALAGIYMTPIPELPYETIYHERTVRSVANATRDDARQLMRLAGEIPLKAAVETFPLEEANRALLALKQSRIRGAGVLVVN
jgi:propanol-preferring alcohol dehydrogenase